MKTKTTRKRIVLTVFIIIASIAIIAWFSINVAIETSKKGKENNPVQETQRTNFQIKKSTL